MQSVRNAIAFRSDWLRVLYRVLRNSNANRYLRLENIFQVGYKIMMPGNSEPKTTMSVSAIQLEALAGELIGFAARLQQAANVAKTQPDESLGVYNWASVPTGLRMIRSFVAKADESRSAAELGRPVPIGQLKPRSTAKKSSLEKAKTAKKIAENAFGRKKPKDS